MSVTNQKPKNERWWDDEDFQDRLASLLIKDPLVLKNCAHVLSPEDFRPLTGMYNGRERWIVVERALEHYEKYHEPLGNLLRSDVLEYASNIHLAANQVVALKEYIDTLNKVKTASPDAVVEKVVRFKSQIMKAAALQEMHDLQLTGNLTDEKWKELTDSGMKAVNGNTNGTISYKDTVEDRIARRKLDAKSARAPWSFIDPLDSMVTLAGRQQLGLVVAPYKRGKSLFLLWLANAYVLQKLNVLYITLEDPRSVVEDRLDAIITNVPIKALNAYPSTIKKRFARFKKMLKTNIEIYDGTEGGVTIAKVEQLILSKRDEGFMPDALMIDYDEEIEPSRKFKDKRFELDDVYRGLRRLTSKYNLIGWTAAQTQRETRNMKILSGDKVAEDIGKMKKVTVALTLGKGDWTDNSYYIWVAAHKNDKMEIGCEIVPDLDRMLIYDREATRREMKAHLDPNV